MTYDHMMLAAFVLVWCGGFCVAVYRAGVQTGRHNGWDEARDEYRKCREANDTIAYSRGLRDGASKGSGLR